MYNVLIVVDSLYYTVHMLNCDSHCTLVSTDLTLTTDRLTELFQWVHVEDSDQLISENFDLYIGPSRKSIGEELGLPESALKEIKKSYQSGIKRKESYLDTYTNHHPCPSWKEISDVLGRYHLYQQAGEVENTYVQGMHACTFMMDNISI